MQHGNCTAGLGGQLRGKLFRYGEHSREISVKTGFLLPRGWGTSRSCRHFLGHGEGAPLERHGLEVV